MGAEPAGDERLDEQQQAEDDDADDEEADGGELPEDLHGVLLVALSNKVADACIHAVAEDVDQEIELGGDDGVVAVERHLHDRDKHTDKNLVAAVENEVLDALDEDLARLLQHLGILLEMLAAFTQIDTQPGVELADAVVEGDDADDGEQQSDEYPQPEVTVVPCQEYLRQALDDSDGLEIGVDEILLLVGRDQQLLIIKYVACDSGGQEGIEGEKDKGQSRTEVAEPPGEEDADQESAAANDVADATVQVGQHGHNLVDLVVVVLLQRLVEEIDDAGADAQLGDAEERHDVHQHACQSNELGSQTVKEHLAREECQYQREHVEQHAHLDIHDTPMYPFAHLFVVGGMDEVGVLVIYLQEVEHHLPDQHGQRENLAEDGMAAQLSGSGDIERDADEEEQQPPLDAPLAGDEGDEDGQHERQHDEHGAGNERLLDGLVDVVDVARDDGLGYVGQQVEQALDLCRHPAQTLLLEVLLVADLLVEDVDVGLVVDMYLLL